MRNGSLKGMGCIVTLQFNYFVHLMSGPLFLWLPSGQHQFDCWSESVVEGRFYFGGTVIDITP
jgi:hypothetical protein